MRRRGRPEFLLLLVPLICCGAPVLVAALVATGVGAWLAANRILFGVTLIVSVIAVAVWIQQRRRLG